MSDNEEIIVLGPETVVARSQQPIPKPALHKQPGAPKVRLQKKICPEPQGVPHEPPAAQETSQTPTSVVHTFYWPTIPTVKGKVPQVYRTVFETKNHPR